MLISQTAIIDKLRCAIPALLAIYAFGSRAQGSATADSDLDLAVLSQSPLDPQELWNASQDLSVLVGCDVDLLDFRRASTVMQYQIITTGQRCWALDAQAALYECFVLSEKTALDEARAGLLTDIHRSGKIYG